MKKTGKKVVAVIPARGGSKGIPGKNIKPFHGIPLLAHSIRAARIAEAVDRVVVSTDDMAIAEVAHREKADIVMRPPEISSDFSRSEDALLHVLGELEVREAYVPDILVFLQCTSPLTTSGDIDGALQEFMNRSADSLVSATPFHYYLWKENDKGEAIGINHDPTFRAMRQERKNQFMENGAIYVMKVKGFLQHRHRFFGKTVIYIMPESRSIEIDEPIDLQIAETMYAYLHNSGSKKEQ
jgi:N-acylneuraminate cytidylyltransferase